MYFESVLVMANGTSSSFLRGSHLRKMGGVIAVIEYHQGGRWWNAISRGISTISKPHTTHLGGLSQNLLPFSAFDSGPFFGSRMNLLSLQQWHNLTTVLTIGCGVQQMFASTVAEMLTAM